MDDDDEYAHKNPDDQEPEDVGREYDSDITLPPTPHYPDTINESKKSSNPAKTPTDTSSRSQPSQKIVEESDIDSFDLVDENQVSSYSKLGIIVPTIRRMVLRGQGKNYYGVGKKNHHCSRG